MIFETCIPSPALGNFVKGLHMSFSRIVFVILLVAFAAASVLGQESSDDAKRVATMLEGTWKVDGKETYEKWEPSGTAFRGKGYKIRNGSEIITEQLEVKVIDDAVYYLATVADQNNGATVRFKLTESGADRLVFENPEHDFPKKIIYRKVLENELAVQVLGDGDKGFAMRFLRQNPVPK